MPKREARHKPYSLCYAVFIESLEARQLLTYNTFAHAGILSTEADFTRMVTKVAANAEPWLSGWNKLRSNGWTHLGMQPGPVDTIVRGETNNSYIMWSQIAQTTRPLCKRIGFQRACKQLRANHCGADPASGACPALKRSNAQPLLARPGRE